MEPLTQEDIALFWKAYEEMFYYEEEPFNEEWDREQLDFEVWERSL